MNVLIVDDEPLARAVLRRFLSEEPDVESIGEARDGPSAIQELRVGRWHAVLLDIRMPGMDGFGVLAEPLPHPPVVVFVTAYQEHAVDAFGVDAADYLLKPVDRSSFQRAMDRIRTRLAQGEVARHGENLIAALQKLQGGSRSLKIRLEDSSGIQIVPVDELLRVEADDKYVVLQGDRRTWRVRRSLSEVEGLLDGDRFIKVHRSCLVARDRIQSLSQTTGGAPIVELDDGSRVRVSKSRLPAVREILRG